jgi:hypothetical protein
MGVKSNPHTMMGQHRLRVSEKKVLRMCGLKTGEVKIGLRELHNELHNLCSTPGVTEVKKSRK